MQTMDCSLSYQKRIRDKKTRYETIAQRALEVGEQFKRELFEEVPAN